MRKRKDGFNGERALVLPISVVQEMEVEPLAAILHITDIGYYPKADHHFRERSVPISQFVFIYCIEGAGWYRLNEVEYKVGKNQYFILPAGVPHEYGADEKEPWTIYWIHFKGKLAGQFASGLTIPIDIKPTIYSRIEGRIELFEEIFRTLEMGYSKENWLYACSVFHHFLGTLRYLQQYRNAVRNNIGETDLVTAAIHFMKENMEKKLTLSEIAAHIGYSPSHFSILFNKRTGYSPLNYFNQLKIQQACQLLDFTDMKVNQICYKIGIDDCYYFSRLFSKIMGVSPRQYKLKKKG
ncbi:AraC family transcriptional regulator [Parabacteroides pacaensis]|uniref:AraC family transcriptional regulator n=1 Tax=Parabacteroides pacaensis TaxID=2086575 RepID=UPI000D0F9697|nr:AraC family transcriptional regulator [Parabacteroides pacaensis]